MKKILSIFILFISCVWFSQSGAVSLTHLYETKVFVENKSVAKRKLAIRQALEKILIKVSGNSKVASVPEVQNQFSQAENYLQRYRYQRIPDSGYWLITNFNPLSVKRLLVSANQAVWGEERPQIITWMVIKQQPDDQLIYSNSGSQVPRLLYQLANFRGLPLILPILDKAALDQVTVDDVLNARLDKLSIVAKRYTAPTILLSTVTPGVTGPWSGDWYLLVDGENLHWQNQGDSLANIAQDGLNTTADLLASRYAILNISGSESEVDIIVGDINDVADYGRVMKYLKKLTAVKEVDVREIKSNAIRFHIVLNGDIHALNQAMKLHPLLIPADQATHTLSREILVYRLKHAA